MTQCIVAHHNSKGFHIKWAPEVQAIRIGSPVWQNIGVTIPGNWSFEIRRIL